MTTSNRDSIRAKIFDGRNKKPATRDVNLWGQTVEVRQPTVRQMNKLATVGADDKVPAIVRVMIEYCYVPGTDEKVFDAADAEQLSSMPMGSWLTDLNKAIEELTSIDIEGAEKN